MHSAILEGKKLYYLCNALYVYFFYYKYFVCQHCYCLLLIVWKRITRFLKSKIFYFFTLGILWRAYSQLYLNNSKALAKLFLCMHMCICMCLCSFSPSKKGFPNSLAPPILGAIKNNDDALKIIVYPKPNGQIHQILRTTHPFKI